MIRVSYQGLLKVFTVQPVQVEEFLFLQYPDSLTFFPSLVNLVFVSNRYHVTRVVCEADRSLLQKFNFLIPHISHSCLMPDSLWNVSPFDFGQGIASIRDFKSGKLCGHWWFFLKFYMAQKAFLTVVHFWQQHCWKSLTVAGHT